MKFTLNRQVGLAICYGLVVVLGMCVPLLGTTFEEISARYGIPIQDAGLFTGLQALSSVALLPFLGRIADRMDIRWLVSLAMALLGGGLLLLTTTDERTIAFVSVFIFGIGMGMLLLLSNVAVVRLAPNHAARALNIHAFSFGVGAIIGPQIVAAALRAGNFLIAYYVSAGFALALVVPLLLIAMPPEQAHLDAASAGTRIKLPPLLTLLPFFALLTLYVGMEVGFASWLFTHARLVAQATESNAANIASAFWLGYTAARGVVIVLAGRVREEALLIATIALFAVAVGIMLLGGQQEAVLLVCAFLGGIGCGPVFPTAMALVRQLFPQSFGAVASLLLAGGNFAVVIVPFVQGQVGGGRDGGMILSFALGLALLVTAVVVSQRTRQQVAVAASAGHP